MRCLLVLLALLSLQHGGTSYIGNTLVNPVFNTAQDKPDFTGDATIKFITVTQIPVDGYITIWPPMRGGWQGCHGGSVAYFTSPSASIYGTVQCQGSAWAVKIDSQISAATQVSFTLSNVRTPSEQRAPDQGYIVTSSAMLRTSRVHSSYNPPGEDSRRLVEQDYGEGHQRRLEEMKQREVAEFGDDHRRLAEHQRRKLYVVGSTALMVGGTITDYSTMLDEGDLRFDRIVIGTPQHAMCEPTRCPGDCSRHGACTECGICQCYLQPKRDSDGTTYPAWTDHDCSKRTCYRGKAWASQATANSVAHELHECSMAGTCDRKSGQCNCFPGYEGIACQRTACPNGCSNKGVCVTQEYQAYYAKKLYTDPWDRNKEQGCICDLGYRGPDCSERECKTGTDPMTEWKNVPAPSHLLAGQFHGRDCSGRGKCNYATGLCECFEGYAGDRCDTFTVTH